MCRICNLTLSNSRADRCMNEITSQDVPLSCSFQCVYSHSMRLLELANYLNMVHKVSSVYILHHKVQSVLKQKDEELIYQQPLLLQVVRLGLQQTRLLKKRQGHAAKILCSIFQKRIKKNVLPLFGNRSVVE